MSTCNRSELQTLGSQLIMPKNLPNRCLRILFTSFGKYKWEEVRMFIVTSCHSLDTREIYPCNLHNDILCNVTPSLLYFETLGNICAQFKSQSPPCCHVSLSYITSFDMKIIHQRIQHTHSHASCCHRCHYCSVDFVLFHNVTCYTNSLLITHSC